MAWDFIAIIVQVITNVYNAGGAKLRWAIWFWAAFVFLYALLGKYDTIHRKSIISERQMAKQNYYYTLHAFGAISLILEYGHNLGNWPTKLQMTKVTGTITFISTLGFILMTTGFVCVLLGRLYLNSFWGKNIYSYKNIKNDYKLVTENIYSHCRHPIYFGQICMCIGTALITNNWYIFGLSILMLLINIWRAHREDTFLSEYFKEEWMEYKNKTPFFVPYIF